MIDHLTYVNRYFFFFRSIVNVDRDYLLLVYRVFFFCLFHRFLFKVVLSFVKMCFLCVYNFNILYFTN